MLYCDSCTSLIADIICPICVTSRQKTIEDLMSDRWSDCSFLVGVKPPQEVISGQVGVEPHQEVISGHKLLLAVASPVFDAMLYGPMAENNHDPIPIDDTDPESFKAMLQYIYTCNIKTDSLDVILNLCYLANKYMLHHLLAECINYLRLEITAENVQEIHKQAQLYDIEILNKACLEMIDLINEKPSCSVSNDEAVAVEQSPTASCSVSNDEAVAVEPLLNRVTRTLPTASPIKKEIADDNRLAEATVRFTIQNFTDLRLKKKTKELITPPFYIWNLPWQLEIENDSNDILSISIGCNTYRSRIDQMYKPPNYSCWAKSDIRIISNKSDVLPLRNIGRTFDLYDSHRTSWRHEFLTWNELLDPSNEYIKDDALILEVKLKVEKPVPVEDADRNYYTVRYEQMDVAFTVKRKFPPSTIL